MKIETSDLITDAFGRDMKPQVNLMRKIQKLREEQKNQTPGTATKVNEKVTVSLQTKPKKGG